MEVNIEIETKNADYVKSLVLETLLRDKIITEEQFEEYCINRQIVVVNLSWFRTFLTKYTREKEWIYKYVKFN